MDGKNQPMKLLSTDFDGTLVGYPLRLSCPTPLAEALEASKSAGAAWVVNTGRSLEYLDEGLVEFAPPHPPDFAIVNERHIFENRTGRWMPLGDWNDRCDLEHHRLGCLSAPALRQILKHAARSLSFEVIEDSEFPSGVVTRDEETMEELVRLLHPLAEEHPDFDFQRNAIYMRFSHRDYSKGSALRELARAAAIARPAILAVGDNHNDLSMLDGEVAGMVACPGNAIEEVREAVRNAGGWVSEHPDALGTAEAIFYFLAPQPVSP